MLPLKAHVRHGRLVLDEPTDLPEGRVVELVPVDELPADDMTNEERAELRRELETSAEEENAAQLVRAADVLAEFQSTR